MNIIREVSIAFDELFSATILYNAETGTAVHDYEMRLGHARHGELEAIKDLERLRGNRTQQQEKIEEMIEEARVAKEDLDESARQGILYADRAYVAEALVAEWEHFNVM